MPFGQSAILSMGKRVRDQAGLVQKFPEAVRMPGEVVASLKGPKPWVNADKQDSEAGTDTIG